MLAEPFEAFTFSPAGASVYQLGTFGTARKELKALVLAPWAAGILFICKVRFWCFPDRIALHMSAFDPKADIPWYHPIGALL